MEKKQDKPYPKIQVEKKNLYYAEILLDDYVGIKSEDTSIMQYIYQSFDMYEILPEFSEILSKIAMVEMRHLALLGKTIKALGLDPKFKYINKIKNRYECWNSSFVDYTTNLQDMLISNIELEKAAIKSYKKHIEIIDDKYIKELLLRIIEDEYIHIDLFNKMLSTIREKHML